jgi:hypothetical protein
MTKKCKRNINSLIALYPKKRPALSSEQREIYEREYVINRAGQSLITKYSMRCESWMHKVIAAYSRPDDHYSSTLEIGAGTLNHLQFEKNIQNYDVVEPFTALCHNRPEIRQIRHYYKDIDEIDTSVLYDRIISIAVFEHITTLPSLIEKAIHHLKPGGVMHASIPTEGSFFWKSAYTLTTGLAYRMRTGLNYANLMRHEHVNSAIEIEQLMRHFFAEVKVQRFPFAPFHMSVYTHISAQKPKL